MMLDRMEGNAELKTSVQQMLATRRLTHSVLLVGEAGLGTGFAARCIAADYLYPAGGAAAEALLRGECCRAVAKAGKRDSGTVETGIVREAISVSGMGSGGKYLVGQVTAMRSEIFNTSLSAEGRAVLLYHVERMNEESANALLKVMEEPPEGVLFLLTADSLASVLPTIRSRCVSFAVAPVSPADCTRYCAAQGVDKKTAALYSELFDGHIGTVLAVARDEARAAQVEKAPELARAAAVRRDRRFTGDERVVRFVLLQIFRIRTMMELRNADNCNHNYDAEQHEKAPADDFFDFHDDSPDCHICIIYGQSHFIIFSAAPSRDDTHDGCEKCRRLVKTMRHPPYICRAHTPVSAGIYSNSIHSLEVPV